MNGLPRILEVLILLTVGAGGLTAQKGNTQAPLVPSDELNKQLPKWLRFSGEYRARIEGFQNFGFREGVEDAYFLNRLRVNMKIQPHGWVSFSFQGQDARAFGWSRRGFPPLAKDSMDLRMAFLELGDSEKKAFGLRAGRQEINLGDQRLMGALNWTNIARTFDGVKATVRHRGLRLDAFASSVVVARDGEFNKRVDGDNIHGLYGTIEKVIPRASLEPFLFWRTSPRRRTEAGAPGNLDFKTAGFRWAGKLPSSLDYQVLVAAQTGSLASDDVGAWAGQWLLGYTLASASWAPRVAFEYNYATGDKNPLDGKRGTFDILYPTAHGLYGLADQVGWKNIHDVHWSAAVKPAAKWRLVGDYHSWWRASLQDGLYNAGGGLIVRSPGPSAGRHVGQELDFQAYYTVNPRIQVIGGVGHIFPGTFLKQASPGASLTFPYVMLGYNF